ncbi:conserved protein of unknown function [Methanoculleus bourgensis]|uniref:Uncharacterized protein n=1 Tax=Methanoculleus bourgensis TaxID=83986 RepID=A0A0X3BQK2_9EURY|nr:conserved protein of unknown function [Methanoculleus bourgensis]
MAQVEDLRSRRLERAGIERMPTIIGEAATILRWRTPAGTAPGGEKRYPDGGGNRSMIRHAYG